jgi:hypothetical protein
MSLASVGARARIPSIGGNQTIDQIEEDLALRIRQRREHNLLGRERAHPQPRTHRGSALRHDKRTGSAVVTVHLTLQQTFAFELVNDAAGMTPVDPGRLDESLLIEPGFAMNMRQHGPFERHQRAIEDFRKRAGTDLVQTPHEVDRRPLERKQRRIGPSVRVSQLCTRALHGSRFVPLIPSRIIPSGRNVKPSIRLD